MNLDDLAALAASGESETMEFKRTTGQLTEGIKAVCAILNGMLPGLVLFGVEDNGRVIGQEVSTRTHEQIANELRRIEPPTFPEIETVDIDLGKSVIVLRVPGGTGLFTYDGRPYHRVGPTTAIMPRPVYDRRLIEHLHGTRRWEREPVAAGIYIDDLDADELYRAIDSAVVHGRLEPPRERHPEAILRGLNLVYDDQMLNAAVALFGSGERLQVAYPQFSLRVARFRGVDRLADFEDNRQYWGHAFSLLRRAETFLLDHVPVAGKVRSGRLTRDDRPLYPPRATREALANALCHRDYASAAGTVTLAMYDDRLEIANPGRLRFGLTPDLLFQPHESRPWNPLIANVFYRTGIIERWGTGTLNMHAWCVEAGAPAPQYSEQADSIAVVFRPAAAPASAPDPGAESGAEWGAESGAESLSDRILQLLADGPLAKSAIASGLGRHSVTGQINEAVRALVTEGVIAYTIPDKPGSRLQRYRLTESGEARLKPPRQDQT